MRLWLERGVVLACSCGLLALGGGAFASDSGVDRGVREVESGDYDAAIVTLDAAARRLSKQPGDGQELSRAYLYLGVAFVGKGHEAAAKARFRQAVRSLRGLSLSAEEFPPKVIGLFEAAREEELAAEAGSSAPKPLTPSSPQVSGSTQKKGGGGMKWLFIGGGLAAAGGGIAVAAGGGGDKPSTPPPPASVRATFEPGRVAIPHTTIVTFTASPSNMTSPAYHWDFGDGTSGAGQSPTHTFPSTGEYHVTVTASDSNGSVSAFVDVPARDIVGRWNEIAVDNYKSELTLRQNGRQVTGTWESFEMMDGGWNRFERVPLEGELEDPDFIRLTAHGFCGTHIEGHFDGEVTQMEVEITFTSGACDPDAFYQRTFVRQ